MPAWMLDSQSRCGTGTVKMEGFRGTAELLERKPARRHQGEQRLLVLRIGHCKLVILGDSTVKVLLTFEGSAKLEPSSGWEVQATCILELFVVLPSGFAILFLQMELAKLDRGLLVAGRVSLAPMKLLEQNEGV